MRVVDDEVDEETQIKPRRLERHQPISEQVDSDEDCCKIPFPIIFPRYQDQET